MIKITINENIVEKYTKLEKKFGELHISSFSLKNLWLRIKLNRKI